MHDPQPVYQNRDPHEYDLWSINVTSTGCDLVSYQYQSEARMSIEDGDILTKIDHFQNWVLYKSSRVNEGNW